MGSIPEFYRTRHAGWQPSIGPYDSWPVWSRRVFDTLSSKQLAGRDILDVGAGTGQVIIALSKEGAQASAIDLSEDSIHWLRENGVDARRTEIGAEPFPFPDGSFDFLVCTETIEHVFDCEALLREAIRVLRPGGELHLTTHNSFNAAMRFRYALGRLPSPSFDILHETKAEHIRLFNEAALKGLFARVGFQEVFAYSFFSLKRFSVRMPFLRNLLAIHHYFICRK
jgi:ubiquinone/menaquinone biosynthesis C-methylase UbiE